MFRATGTTKRTEYTTTTWSGFEDLRGLGDEAFGVFSVQRAHGRPHAPGMAQVTIRKGSIILWVTYSSPADPATGRLSMAEDEVRRNAEELAREVLRRL
jgi:hypothetical protein